MGRFMIKKIIRKIIQNGRGTYYVNIPKVIMNELGWKERQKLVIKRRGKKVIIEDWER